jgi:class 3 adenylate cyclase
MSAAEGQRKLAAIMFTDMVGFSALAQRNEARAIELLEEHRRLVRTVLPKHGGREVKTTGDGFLLEFPSALAAIQCAVAIQQALHARNSSVSPGNEVQIRIGIHVGDVISSQGDIHGDGVNIAARLEPLAAPGGICISSAVWEQVRNKVDHPLALLGPAELKNIELPVVVHRVVMPWESAASSAPVRASRKPFAWIAAILILAVLGVLLVLLTRKRPVIPTSSEIILFTTGFEPPGYQPGPLVGQQGWSAYRGHSLDAATVVVSDAGQHVLISGSALQHSSSNSVSGWFFHSVTNGLPDSDAMRISLSADVQFLPGSAFEHPGRTIVNLTLNDDRFNAYAAIGFGRNSRIFGQNFAPTNQIVWAEAGPSVIRHLRADFDFATRTASFTVDGLPFGQLPFNPMATNRPANAAFALQADHPIDSLLQVHNFTVTATPGFTNSAGTSVH